MYKVLSLTELCDLRGSVESYVSTCFSGRLLALMAGKFSAKHVHWKSMLSTSRGKLLRDYTDKNSCLIFGLDSPITNPYNSSVTPAVLDIVVTKKLSFWCI